MYPIRKKILTDESQQPLAVQIDYADWLVLEKWLESHPLNGNGGTPASIVPPSTLGPIAAASDLNRFSGTLRLAEDPLVYQERSRDEWR
ncbi:MAG: hypothetical protein H7210_11715 [Pyrinomonadaceae bacterium]|nr:hypothetical protein [Phycisphaerales bacterium]